MLFYRRRVVNPLAGLNQNLRDLLARKAGVSIGNQQENSEIGELARSMETYRVTVDEAERQRWVKSSIADIDDALQGAEEPDQFGRQLLSKLVPLVGGGCGAFHLLDEESGRYRPVSGYGIDQRRRESSFAPGEGLAGQAAVERKVIVLSDIPADYVRIGSGLGDAPPRTIAVVPIATSERVAAVLEVASFGGAHGPAARCWTSLGNDRAQAGPASAKPANGASYSSRSARPSSSSAACSNRRPTA